MKRVLSRIGVGAATVETVLPRSEFEPGETVEATVEVTGGQSEQTIDEFYFALMATAGSGDDTTFALDSFKVVDGVVIGAEETRSIGVEFTIPPWTPITRDDVEVWIETGLDIDWAVDPGHTARIDVVPDPFVAALFATIDGLGFAYQTTTVRTADRMEDRPVVQEFTFVPRSDPYREQLDALTVTCIPRDDHLRVIAGIDRVDAVADEAGLDFDEQEIPLKLTVPDAARMRGRLKNELDNQL